MPWTYRHAEKEFRAFLEDAKAEMDLASDNMAYTAVDAVFQVFRRRLRPEEAVAFADLLPSLLRAIFLYHWDVMAAPLPFASREDLTKEAQRIRQNHNLTPDNAIRATAYALRRSLRQRDLDKLLAQLPEGAAEFWHVEVDDPSELEQRIL